MSLAVVPSQLFDVAAWVENFWIPAVLAFVIWAVTAVPKWWANRANERRKADADARKVASREFAKVAIQIRSLGMYEFGSGMYDNARLAEKQDECLETILLTTYGPAAKVARNASDATLPRVGVTATSVTVGNMEGFAKAYKLAQLEYLHGETNVKPGARLDLRVWAATYEFASKVLDPHRIGPPLGFHRLALRSADRVADIGRAEGRVPPKAGLISKLRWIYSV